MNQVFTDITFDNNILQVERLFLLLFFKISDNDDIGLFNQMLIEFFNVNFCFYSGGKGCKYKCWNQRGVSKGLLNLKFI